MELMNLQRQIVDDSDNNITSQDEKNTSSDKPLDYSTMNELDQNFHSFFFPSDSEDKVESEVNPSSVGREQNKHNKKKTQI